MATRTADGLPNLRHVIAWQTLLQQRPNRIAVGQPAIRVAQIEVRIEREQANLLQCRIERMHTRPRHRVVAA